MLKTKKRDIFGFCILLVIAALAFIIFKLIESGALDGLRSNFSSDWQDVRNQTQIVKENTRDFFAPSRKPPLSFLIAQESLKQNLPVPFANFAEQDWQDFWRLIYGTHETDDSGSVYSITRRRQLSIEEIEQILMNDYPQIFSRFDRRMWDEFWKLAFKD
jgi:hypothetical protein